MTETEPRVPRRAAFIFVFITVLLDMLALGIVVPVLPKLVVDFFPATPRAPPRSTGFSAPPGR
jgi:MFS transporter, DHA1 family, tetracycline resistance protein